MSRLLLTTVGFNQLVRGKDGYYLYNRNDMYIGKSMEMYGEYGADELNALRQLCAAGDIVIEAGANIGAHTLGLAQQVGPGGRVLAFEPQRLVFQTLCANVALNSLQNVDCYWAALGARAGFVTVPELDPAQSRNFGSTSLVNAVEGIQVECLTLDRFASLPGVKLVKIDVEGMEADVLEGGRALLAKFRPLLYVENNLGDKSERLMRLIDSLGYRMHWHLSPLFNPQNAFGEKQNIYPGMVSTNILCVHRDAQLPVEGSPEVTDFSRHPLQR
jgi:FkbM family methyltransferase